MRLMDLSQPIFDAGPNCPAHPPVRSEITADHTRGNWHWETLTLASHTGSHLDAPLHKIAGGAAIDALPLERFVGTAYVADLRGIEPQGLITPERLASALPADPNDWRYRFWLWEALDSGDKATAKAMSANT